jgi:hypothetical protein
MTLIGMSSVSVVAQSTWTDPATGMIWAGQDNGADINWSQASSYCANLQLGGYSGWRLPTIKEFTAIHDWNQNVGGYYIKGGIRLSGESHWSSSAGDASGKVLFFSFHLSQYGLAALQANGVAANLQNWGYTTASWGLRALCVRNP